VTQIRFVRDYEHAAEIAMAIHDLIEKMLHMTPKQSDSLYELLLDILFENAVNQDYLNHN